MANRKSPWDDSCSSCVKKHPTQMSVEGLYSSIATKCRVTAERDAGGGGIPQKARRAVCLSPKPTSGAESAISPQNFHFQQLKVISHSQGWRNAPTSGANPIFKHVSQLSNHQDDEECQIRCWPRKLFLTRQLIKCHWGLQGRSSNF